MYNPTLRTEEDESIYQQAIADKTTEDIGKVNADAVIGGLKLVPNAFPYSMVAQKNKMLVGNKDFWDFWIKLGLEVLKAEEDPKNSTLASDYDALWYNLPKRQSQPHVRHIHAIKLKKREDFKL